MNDRSFVRLLRFNLQAMPPAIWYLFPLFLFTIAIQTWLGGMEGNGFEEVFLQSSNLSFSVIAGMLFLMNRIEVAARKITLIRCDEFLLSRPLSRGRCYGCFIAIYFALMLAPFVAELAVTLPQPDLKFSLYASKSYRTEAVEKLALYQEVFPNSAVVQAASAGHRTLVMPHGRTLVAAWWLAWMTWVTVGMQCVPLLRLPVKIQRWAPAVFMPLILAPSLFLIFGKNDLPEEAFFVFVRHWPLIGLAVLGLFAAVQWLAWRRVEVMEVG